LLVIPAFWLHEGTFVLTAVLLACLVVRVRAATGSHSERLFVGAAFLLLAAILAYQISWIIHPQFPGDRTNAVQGLIQFEFLYADHRFNLPLMIGGLALLALSAVSFVHAAIPTEKAARFASGVLFTWLVIALAAVAAAITIDATVAPLAQTRARYHPAIVSAALGVAVIVLKRLRLPDSIWNNTKTLLVLISLWQRRRPPT
jgi:hypothetical protein